MQLETGMYHQSPRKTDPEERLQVPYDAATGLLRDPGDNTVPGPFVVPGKATGDATYRSLLQDDVRGKTDH